MSLSSVYCIPDHDFCDESFNATKGNFSSPNYPNNYPNLANCQYLFNIPNASSISFEVQTFETRLDQDYLYMGNGASFDIDNAMYTFSGWADVPSIFTVEGGLWWFLFSSDIASTTVGFNITWEAFVGKSTNVF